MSILEKIREKLNEKFFNYKNHSYKFTNCKQVNSNIMILTDSKTLQIPIDQGIEFLDQVELIDKQISVKESNVPAVQPMREMHIIQPEHNKVFEALNTSMASLLEELQSCDEDALKTLEIKARMITSIGQTAVSIQNSKTNVFRSVNRL